MALLHYVAEIGHNNHDGAYILEGMIEKWNTIGIRSQAITDYDPLWPQIEDAYYKIKSLHTSITRLLKPSSRTIRQDDSQGRKESPKARKEVKHDKRGDQQERKDDKKVHFSYIYESNAKYDIPKAILNNLKTGKNHENKRDNSSHVNVNVLHGDAVRPPPSLPLPARSQPSAPTTAAMNLQLSSTNSIYGAIPSLAQSAARHAASRSSGDGTGRYTGRQSPSNHPPQPPVTTNLLEHPVEMEGGEVEAEVAMGAEPPAEEVAGAATAEVGEEEDLDLEMEEDRAEDHGEHGLHPAHPSHLQPVLTLTLVATIAVHPGTDIATGAWDG